MKELVQENLLVYKKATREDIAILIEIRIEVLRAANQLSEDIDMTLVKEESYEYYKNSFDNDDHVTYLVYKNNEFVACGGISFYRVMPTYHNTSGKKAYIMNMYTRANYRRQGIALTVLDKLVGEAKRRNIIEISLEATEMGRTVYEKYGFINIENEMTLV